MSIRTEDELVRLFQEHVGDSVAVRSAAAAGLQVGIGDDCAVLRPLPGEDLLWTVDALEEDVDFLRSWLTLEEIGGRAVASTLSDIAGMGGRVLAILLVLGTGSDAPAGELTTLFKGAARAAGAWGAAVAGGDVTRRAGGVGVAATALGAVPEGRALLRTGALAGDALWVTGRLGLAALGRELLHERGRADAETEHREAVRQFVAPTPRLTECRWLMERATLHAGMDLSDGLAPDLARLCSASRVGARLETEALERAAVGAGEDARRRALYGGEDFELLLAAPADGLERLAEEFEHVFDVSLHRVGELIPERELVLREDGRDMPLESDGWDHVRPSRP